MKVLLKTGPYRDKVLLKTGPYRDESFPYNRTLEGWKFSLKQDQACSPIGLVIGMKILKHYSTYSYEAFQLNFFYNCSLWQSSRWTLTWVCCKHRKINKSLYKKDSPHKSYSLAFWNYKFKLKFNIVVNQIMICVYVYLFRL